MIRVGKILCPVDFFPASEVAARYAAGLARERDAKLKLLHVVSPIMATAHEFPVNMGDIIKDIVKASNRELKALVSKFKASESEVEYDVRTGEIVREIKRAIAQYKPDLVVMGTHGRRSLGRWILGSTTERLLRHSPVPLLITSDSRRRSTNTGFRRILVTTDFSDGTTDALKYAFSFAQENQSTLTLLHV